MKKKISIGVILLFIVLALAPTINGNSDFELIEELKDKPNNEDCGYYKSIDWDFPILCSILLVIYWIAWDISPYPRPLLAVIIEEITYLLGGCPGIP